MKYKKYCILIFILFVLLIGCSHQCNDYVWAYMNEGKVIRIIEEKLDKKELKKLDIPGKWEKKFIGPWVVNSEFIFSLAPQKIKYSIEVFGTWVVKDEIKFINYVENIDKVKKEIIEPELKSMSFDAMKKYEEILENNPTGWTDEKLSQFLLKQINENVLNKKIGSTDIGIFEMLGSSVENIKVSITIK
ncbi:MAG: hypothetical protein PQJ46_16400 [Spirochaetales bacterium]|nr:hypothetical protein [Spirochaetales bacterium]